jgi:TrmH family RNA methyltransferase
MSRSDLITSADNAKLKLVRRLQRRRDPELFVAEGEDLVFAGGSPRFVLVAADSGLEGIEVEPALLAGVSALGSGTRAIGVFERPPPVAPAGPLCVALWGVRDPGNVGTILRSALAFGADSVAFGPDCADPFGPKAVRASMGAVFDVAIATAASLDDLPRPRVALAAREGDVLRGPLHEATLLVGAEREGLPPDVVEACERVAHIPIRSESLNAAMAATLALYEAVR